MSYLNNYNVYIEQWTIDQLTEKPPWILVVASTLLQYERITKSRAVVGHTALYINRPTLIDLTNIRNTDLHVKLKRYSVCIYHVIIPSKILFYYASLTLSISHLHQQSHLFSQQLELCKHQTHYVYTDFI